MNREEFEALNKEIYEKELGILGLSKTIYDLEAHLEENMKAIAQIKSEIKAKWLDEYKRRKENKEKFTKEDMNREAEAEIQEQIKDFEDSNHRIEREIEKIKQEIREIKIERDFLKRKFEYELKLLEVTAK